MTGRISSNLAEKAKKHCTHICRLGYPTIFLTFSARRLLSEPAVLSSCLIYVTSIKLYIPTQLKASSTRKSLDEARLLLRTYVAGMSTLDSN